jgi:DNA-binding IclR family transcriptional regulator
MAAVKTRTVPALHKALRILELLTASRTGATLPELVAQSGLAKSSAHYLLVTLERDGYVRRTERTGRYLLGVKLFRLANSAINGLSLRQRSAAHLWALSMRTGLTVHFAILEQGEAVLIGKQEGTGAARVATWIGKRMDLHCTAVGKAIFAYLPKAEIDAILRERGLSRHNENTIATPLRLHQELERVMKRGYAIDDEEDELGLRCIGVPVFGRQDRPLGAISVSGLTSNLGAEDLTRLLRDLRQTAAAIGYALVEPAVASLDMPECQAPVTELGFGTELSAALHGS